MVNKYCCYGDCKSDSRKAQKIQYCCVSLVFGWSILSPLLFTVYLDDLSMQLNSSNVGCTFILMIPFY